MSTVLGPCIISAMVKLIADKQIELSGLCKRFGVKTLEIFGSAARDARFTETSDLDFLVDFLPKSPTEHADAYFGLLDALKGLFGREIDLLEVKAIDNPYLLESINRNRLALYAA